MELKGAERNGSFCNRLLHPLQRSLLVPLPPLPPLQHSLLVPLPPLTPLQHSLSMPPSSPTAISLIAPLHHPLSMPSPLQHPLLVPHPLPRVLHLLRQPLRQLQV